MTGQQLRELYLSYYESKGHVRINPAPLIPQNDSTSLFTLAGMQPLIPYLLGQKHLQGDKLVDSQPCFRATDIEEVGDNRHTTFFEMLGNWSLGSYFKKEQLTWFFNFLTQELGLSKDKLYVTVFEGDDSLPKDTESESIWLELGIDKDHIYKYGVTKNFWSRAGTPDQMPVGEPGGTTSEVFYEFSNIKHSTAFGKTCHPNCDCGRFMEIGNSVFMEYQKNADGTLSPLPQKNVDFGGGLERILAAVNNDPDIFTTDLFSPIITVIEDLTQTKYQDNLKAYRIIADHLKAATMMIAEGLEPSNKQQGYFLRRLIRRASLKLHQLHQGLLDPSHLVSIVTTGIIPMYQAYLKDGKQLEVQISNVLNAEAAKFLKTLDKGLKLLDQTTPFDLYQSYGFPPELTEELLAQKNKSLDWDQFNQDLKNHQHSSRTASKGMFKGGLIDSSITVTKYHTATHLLHQALRTVLGEHVRQMGSNITKDRLRFDFTHSEPLNTSQLEAVETIINQKISEGLSVKKETTNYQDAIKDGALAFFNERYPDVVTVYTIGDFSKEVCGGPHVENTQEIGKIKLTKQESIGTGKRRIYAVLA